MTTLGPYGYSGGWNTKVGPYDVPDTCYVDAQNVEIINNRIAKKKGCIQWTTGDHPGGANKAITGLANYNTFLVAYCGSKIASASNSTSGAWTDITGAATFTPTDNCWMVSINNILVMGGGGNTTPVQWTGTGNVSVVTGSPPANTTCAAMANNYLFTGGNNQSVNPARVFWSAILNPNSWPAANFVDVRVNDNEMVTSLAAFGEDLLIFKKTCVARFYTNQLSATLGPLVIVNEKIGCAGPQCVDRLPDGRITFIGTNNHVYIYDGNSFEDISDPSYPRSNIQSILSSIAFGSSAFNQGCLCVYPLKSQIWITYPFTFTNKLGTSFTAGVVFIYDYSIGSWCSPFVDRRIYKMVNYQAGSSDYLISAGNQYLYREDTGDVNYDAVASSTNINSYVTKSIFFNSDSMYFQPSSAYLPLYSGSFIGSFCYGANGFLNPTSFNNYSFVGPVTERKKVSYLSTPSGGWNTGQFRFNGGLSNQYWILSPFFLSDDKMEQV